MPKKGGDVLRFDPNRLPSRPSEGSRLPVLKNGGEVAPLHKELSLRIAKEVEDSNGGPEHSTPPFTLMDKKLLAENRAKLIKLFHEGRKEVPLAELEALYDTETILHFVRQYGLSHAETAIVARAEAGDTTAFEEAGRILQEAYRKFYIAYVDVYVSARKPENMRFPFRERPQPPVPPGVAEEEGLGGLGEGGYRRNADGALRKKKKPKVISFWDWLRGKE
jgi:hypothetical protein